METAIEAIIVDSINGLFTKDCNVLRIDFNTRKYIFQIFSKRNGTLSKHYTHKIKQTIQIGYHVFFLSIKEF